MARGRKSLFTKKHYEVIANRLAQSVSDIKDRASQLDYEDQDKVEMYVVETLAMKLCETFGGDNPEFDWYRFLTACGLDANKLLEGDR